MNRSRSFVSTAIVVSSLPVFGWLYHRAVTAPAPPLVAALLPAVSASQLTMAALAPQAADPAPPAAPAPQVLAPPPPPGVNGAAAQHDTPIIIQGGSLLVWSKKPFTKDAHTKWVVTPVPEPISLIKQFKDAGLSDVALTYTIPVPMQTSWAICAREPHFVRIAPLGSSEIAMTSWGKNTGQDVFSDDTPDSKYPFKQRHREPGKLQGLYFGQGACKTIERVSKGNCSIDLSNAPCFVDCPAGKCWIGLDYKGKPDGH